MNILLRKCLFLTQNQKFLRWNQKFEKIDLKKIDLKKMDLTQIRYILKAREPQFMIYFTTRSALEKESKKEEANK